MLNLRKHTVAKHTLIDKSSLLTLKSGNALSFQIFGKVIVVLNTVEAAKDLLEKRSAIYSGRPGIPVYDMCVHELYT